MKGSIKLWISTGITIIGWIIYLYPCLAIIVFTSIFAIWIEEGENYTIDEDTPLLQLFYTNPIHWVILAIIKINKLANKYLSD